MKEDLEDIIFDQGALMLGFLRSRPFLKVNAIEKAAGMPKNNLTLAVAGKRNVPIKYWHNLNKVLVDYGYKSSDIIEADPPFDFELPFKYMDITVLDGAIHFNKNYSELKNVIEFLNIASLGLEKHMESEIESFGKEFILRSRFIK